MAIRETKSSALKLALITGINDEGECLGIRGSLTGDEARKAYDERYEQQGRMRYVEKEKMLHNSWQKYNFFQTKRYQNRKFF